MVTSCSAVAAATYNSLTYLLVSCRRAFSQQPPPTTTPHTNNNNNFLPNHCKESFAHNTTSQLINRLVHVPAAAALATVDNFIHSCVLTVPHKIIAILYYIVGN